MVLDFLKELFVRIGEKTPWFFNVIRWGAGIVSVITAVLAFIQTNLSTVELPVLLGVIASYNASISAFLVALVSSLPVVDTEKLKEKLGK